MSMDREIRKLGKDLQETRYALEIEKERTKNLERTIEEEHLKKEQLR